MPVFLQICAGVVTMAIVAIAIATIRALVRFERVAETLTETADVARRSISEAREVTHEAHELVAALADAGDRVKATVNRFSELGDRVATLSRSVVDEVEWPVREAVAVARGVRATATTLIERLSHRVNRRLTATNGGLNHA
jgi:uncharacterized protein YoxC